MKILLGAFLVGGAIYTCGGIKVPEVTGVELTQMDSFVDGKFIGRGIVKIKNNHAIQISSKNVEFDLFYKNKKISSGESQENFVLKGKEVTNVPVRFALLVDSLLPDANEILQKDSVELKSEVKGNFTAFNFKMSHSQLIKLSTDQLVNGLVGQMAKESFKLTNTKINKISFETTSFNIDLQLKNQFPFDLAITGAHFFVYNKKGAANHVSEWGLEKGLTIAPKEDTTITSQVLVNNLQATSGLLEKLINRKLDFFIDGTVSVNFKGTIINIPLEQHLVFNPLTGEVQVESD